MKGKRQLAVTRQSHILHEGKKKGICLVAPASTGKCPADSFSEGKEAQNSFTSSREPHQEIKTGTDKMHRGREVFVGGLPLSWKRRGRGGKGGRQADPQSHNGYRSGGGLVVICV